MDQNRIFHWPRTDSTIHPRSISLRIFNDSPPILFGPRKPTISRNKIASLPTRFTFISEGDLSLAGVASATRRHHRDQQTKIRGSRAGRRDRSGERRFFCDRATGSVDPVAGTTVTQGRSVLRLRVLAISHGNWKITSIDEVNK